MSHLEHFEWFEGFRSTPAFEHLKTRPIAYFCAEYALDSRLPSYAGGLGILAGDVVREAADRGLPFVAVGLFYREGYRFDIKDKDPEKCGVKAVLGADGKPVLVKVPIQDRDILVRAWKRAYDGVAVYMLDTDVEGNAPADRAITAKLYVGEKETRLKQEIVLGIGGLRMLETLGIHPSVYHLNEGHSAILSLELVRHEMVERKLGFDQALQYARRRIVLSNHTLVAAGDETFSNDLASTLLARYAEELQVPASDLVRLGLVQESSIFSLTMLAFRMTALINAVSRLHARKAKEIWADHPMVAVTNGVHVPTWDRVRLDEPDEAAMKAAHRVNKKNLLAIVKRETGRDWNPDHLLLGWARRIVTYKRPLSLIDDVGRFLKIAADPKKPVRVIFAGHPHPSDTNGQELLEELKRRIDGDLKEVACYLPHYDLELSPYLTSGTDVWLNTPVVGFEACGTSGMKAMLNGSLPCSTRDGWVDEAELDQIGWLLDSSKVNDSLMVTLEKQIVPAYYGNGSWAERMTLARELAKSQFSATRMLREYVEMLYS